MMFLFVTGLFIYIALLLDIIKLSPNFTINIFFTIFRNFK